MEFQKTAEPGPRPSGFLGECDQISITALSHAVAIMNLDLTIRAVNATYMEVFPFDPDTLIGSSVYALAERGSNETFFAALEASSVDGRRRTIRNPSADFGRIFDNIISPVDDYIVVEINDVTQAVADERAVRILDAVRDHVFARNHDLIAIIDFETPRIAANESFRSVLGDLSWVNGLLESGALTPAVYTEADLRRTGAPEFFVGLHSELVGVWATGEDYRTSGSFATPSGIRTLSITITRWDFDGRARGLAVVGNDLTELLESRRRAEQAVHVQRFAQGVAHDFGNIAQVVGGYAQMLRLHPSPEVVAAAAESLAVAADRAVAVSQRIATVARLQQVANSRMDLADLVRRHRAHFEAVVGPGVEITVDASRPALVVANPDQLLSAVENLCHNASRAVHGIGEVRVSVRTDVDQGIAILEVADRGPGLPREIQDHLFEPFNSTASATGGTGLGLYLLREYIAAIGGVVIVDSGPGGTTFAIHLDLA